MFSCNKLSKNSYAVKPCMETLKEIGGPDNCLLLAVICELSKREFSTSTAFALKNGLNIVMEHIDELDIKNLLLEEPKNVSVHHVIAGFKAFERYIEECPLSKKGPISSIVRSIVSDTGFLMNDGLSIGLCRFNTRFIKDRIILMPNEACMPSDIYAIKIKSKNTSSAYWTIDPDSLSGVIKPNGLLARSLKISQEESYVEPFNDEIPQSWLLTLQDIFDSHENDKVLHLFNSNPKDIKPLEVLMGLIQLEDILSKDGIKTPFKKSSLLRGLLVKGGSLGDVVNLSQYEFNTKLSKNSGKSHEVFTNIDNCLPIKVMLDDSTKYYFIKKFPLSEDCIINRSLNNLSRNSNLNPFLYSKFIQLRIAVNILLNSLDFNNISGFLSKKSEEINFENIVNGFYVINDFFVKNCKYQPEIKFREIEKLILDYGDIDSGLVQFYISRNDNVPRVSSAILSVGNDVLSEYVIKGSVLYECFSNSKWDNLIDSDSTENYKIRVAISKLLEIVLNRDSPFTKKFLSMPCEYIELDDIYSCYSEVYFLGCYEKFSGFGVDTFMGFLERNLKNKKVNGKIKSIFTYGHKIENEKKSLDVDFVFTLQNVYGKDLNNKYLPFDSRRFPGIMARDGLLHDCLSASSSEPMEYKFAMGLRKDLEDFSNSNFIKIKEVLNSKKVDISPSMLIEAFIEFESMLEKKYPKHNRFRALRSESFRIFLNKWCGPISGFKSIRELGFHSRFDAKGNRKCGDVIKLEGKDVYGGNVFIEFNTFLNPEFFKNDGILSVSLLALNYRLDEFSLEDLENLKFLIDFIILNYSKVELNYSPKHFFSIPISSCDRSKVVQSLKGLESIIEFMDVKFKEYYFDLLFRFLCLSDEKLIDGRYLSDIGYKSKFTQVNLENVVDFCVNNKVNGKLTKGVYSWDINEIKLLNYNDGSFINAIYTLSEKSKLNPEFRTFINALDMTFKLIFEVLNQQVINIDKIERNKDILKLLNSPPESLERKDVTRGFSGLEDVINETKRANKARISESFRRFLSDNNGAISNGLKMNDCGFKTRFSARKERRDIELIIPINEITGETITSPIINPEKPISKLKEEINDYYQKPIDSILNAAKKEFDLYQKLVNEFSILVKLDDSGDFSFKIPKDLKEFVALASQDNSESSINKKKLEEFIKQYDSTTVLAAFLQRRLNTPVENVLYCPGKNLIIPEAYVRWFGGSASRMKPFFWSHFILPKPILLMCFIRLIIHTTWNKDPVATLRGEDIPYPLSQRRFFIQGNKSKVAKLTSPVEVAPSDTEVRNVIELLGMHYNSMIKLGFSPSSVWETPFSKGLSFLNKSNLKEFIDHYGLPEFGIEQLAKHQINVRKGIDGNICKSQVERNHSQLKTTAGYVDHPLARIYYEANNAEFQRRLEATVTFRHSGAHLLSEYGLSFSDVDFNLLKKPEDDSDVPHWFLLPDGSTCTYIWAPIDKDNTNQKMCGGRKCHSGAGCKYNKVIIGITDFVNTLRHQIWFIDRCETLLERHTPEYFDEYISPSMRFTFGLVRYVETANPEMYRDAQQVLMMSKEEEE